MKTSELTGAALDWAVAKCVWTDRPVVAKAGCRISVTVSPDSDPNDPTLRFFYETSTNWAQGGPIIERELLKISPYHNQGGWWAEHAITKKVFDGPTPLIAAMRCYVASKLGNEVEIPEELKS
jgi:hypothetical protein